MFSSAFKGLFGTGERFESREEFIRALNEIYLILRENRNDRDAKYIRRMLLAVYMYDYPPFWEMLEAEKFWGSEYSIVSTVIKDRQKQMKFFRQLEKITVYMLENGFSEEAVKRLNTRIAEQKALYEADE